MYLWCRSLAHYHTSRDVVPLLVLNKMNANSAQLLLINYGAPSDLLTSYCVRAWARRKAGNLNSQLYDFP